MEGRVEEVRKELQQKLARLVAEAAETAVALQRADGTVVGVPHYTVIELAAHELGRDLSRQVQQRHLRELAAAEPPRAPCPECGQRCELEPQSRDLTSIDGPLEATELVGRCPFCRRDFFPAASAVGPERAAADSGVGRADRDRGGGNAQLPAGSPGAPSGGRRPGVGQDGGAGGPRRGTRAGRAARPRPQE